MLQVEALLVSLILDGHVAGYIDQVKPKHACMFVVDRLID